MSDDSMNYPGTNPTTADYDRPGRSTEGLGMGREKRVTQAVKRGYDQTMVYGREHPRQMNLLLFGAGLGVGILLASRLPARQRNRYRLLARPLIEALAEVGRVLTR